MNWRISVAWLALTTAACGAAPPPGPAGGQVAREGGVILAGTLAAEGQLEAALAVLVAVARARVAPGLGEDGHDVVVERNVRRRPGA